MEIISEVCVRGLPTTSSVLNYMYLLGIFAICMHLPLLLLFILLSAKTFTYNHTNDVRV